MLVTPVADFPFFDAAGRLAWPAPPPRMHCRIAMTVRMIRAIVDVDWSLPIAAQLDAIEADGFSAPQIDTIAEDAMQLWRHYRGSYFKLFAPHRVARNIAAGIAATARTTGAPAFYPTVTRATAAEAAHGLVEIVAGVRMLTAEAAR